MKKKDDTEIKNALLVEMIKHVGATNKISMSQLQEAIFGDAVRNTINDTRRIRRFITMLRKEGIPIVSDTSNSGGGYYLSSAGSELAAYTRKLKNIALRKLAQAAKLEKQTLPGLLGQMQLELETDMEAPE